MKKGKNGCVGCEEGVPMPGYVVCSWCIEELGALTEEPKVYWLSPVKEVDDFGSPILDEIVDGKTS